MKKILSLIFLAFLIFGCSSHKEVKQVLHDNDIVVENDKVFKYFELISVNKAKKDHSLTQVEAIFKNKTGSKKLIAYKVDWFESDGFSKDNIMSRWVVANVEPSRTFKVYSVSPSQSADNYKIYLTLPSDRDKQKNTALNYELQ